MMIFFMAVSVTSPFNVIRVNVVMTATTYDSDVIMLLVSVILVMIFLPLLTI